MRLLQVFHLGDAGGMLSTNAFFKTAARLAGGCVELCDDFGKSDCGGVGRRIF